MTKKTGVMNCDLKCDWSDGDEPTKWLGFTFDNGGTYVLLYDKANDKATIKKQ